MGSHTDKSSHRRAASTGRSNRSTARVVARSRTAGRPGRLHGLLTYATGMLLVLSTVYGTVHTVSDGDNVITDSAASLRSMLLGPPARSMAADRAGVSAAPGQNSRGARQGQQKERGAPPAAGQTKGGALPGQQSQQTQQSEQAQQSEQSEQAQQSEQTQQSGQAQQSEQTQQSQTSEQSEESGTSATSTTQAAEQVMPEPPAGTTTRQAVATGDWLSGASGVGVGNGALAAWRGSPVEIAGTWADNNTAMVKAWSLRPGGEYGSWQQSIDIAVGAFGPGESWQQAAGGAYDGRWRETLTNLRNVWGSRPGTVYIRFAHEMNGNWYPWSVDAGDKDAFIASWRRFHALQEQIFPDAQLVFCVNRESVGSGFNWTKSFPGSQYVDVMAVDYYNQFPYVANAEDWAKTAVAVDGHGAPKGLQKHLDFARSVGLPLAFPEWSGNADNGDSTVWIEKMHEFFRTNAGGGAGQVVYEIQFNVDRDGRRWLLHGDTRMPKSAEAYRRAF